MKRAFCIALALVFGAAAQAGDEGPAPLCFEVIGCVQDRVISRSDAEKLGCEQLFTVRNGIFAARGYCFHTERGRQEFGNDGCRYALQEDVPLNDRERENIRIIQAVEKQRGC